MRNILINIKCSKQNGIMGRWPSNWANWDARNIAPVCIPKVNQLEQSSTALTKYVTCSIYSPTSPVPFWSFHTILSAWRLVFSLSNAARVSGVPCFTKVLTLAMIWQVQKEFALPNCGHCYSGHWTTGQTQNTRLIKRFMDRPARRWAVLPFDVCAYTLTPES